MQFRSAFFRPVSLTTFLLLLANCIFAQTGGGGAAAGMGKAFEAAGKSAAAKDLQQKMNTTLLRAIAKGKAANTTVRRGGGQGRPKAARPTPATPLPSDTADDGYTHFTPDPNSNYAAILADSLGTNDTERVYLRQLFAATKTAFEKEVAAKGRGNNLAAALTFFVASTVTVYHDDPEPSDAAIDKLWDGMNSTLDEMPAMSGLTDAEKQQMYDTLVAFSGLVLAGYSEGKTSNDPQTTQLYKKLAGALIQTVLKSDPEKLRFGRDGLNSPR
ncbi:MAG TPA: DUF6683 family protein [Pyrinomonadaceae bacterium]|nr:DUF6683 family protein [Pyrinomonadaceae bacterium]